jgi:hypothetical protein
MGRVFPVNLLSQYSSLPVVSTTQKSSIQSQNDRTVDATVDRAGSNLLWDSHRLGECHALLIPKTQSTFTNRTTNYLENMLKNKIKLWKFSEIKFIKVLSSNLLVIKLSFTRNHQF